MGLYHSSGAILSPFRVLAVCLPGRGNRGLTPNPTVEGALEGWPKEVEGLHRFAGQRRERADRLEKGCSLEPTVEATLERARKAENLADDMNTTRPSLGPAVAPFALIGG
jgi:hypothetical protein